MKGEVKLTSRGSPGGSMCRSLLRDGILIEIKGVSKKSTFKKKAKRKLPREAQLESSCVTSLLRDNISTETLRFQNDFIV